MESTIGLIGLGTMGSALARNIASKKFRITVYNRTTEKTDEYIQKYGGPYLIGEKTLAAFVATLSRPRKIIIMVEAGQPVDAVISALEPLLDTGDIIIDCGNSNYRDTIRRFEALKKNQLHFIGCGVSGGEEGALIGPSMQPGGDIVAWKQVRKIFEAVAAKDFSGSACVTYIGDNGAGHYVKMVHNGIEYGVMQLIAEAYDILRKVYGLTAPEIAEVCKKFQKGKLQSYLFDITIPVLRKKDTLKTGYLIDVILDKAGQKGTGRWTVHDAIDRAVATPTITEAVFARMTSGDKELRLALAKQYRQPTLTPRGKSKASVNKFIPLLEDALFASMLTSYAQGFALIAKAAKEEGWNIDLGEVSRIWEGGCIIRAKILGTLHLAYKKSGHQEIAHLFALTDIAKSLKKTVPALREVVALVSMQGVPIPTLASSLSYFDSMITTHSSAAMIQGLRDYFGAHTYERSDRPGVFHTDWK